MSDIGYISRRYNQISELTDEINEAAIIVKKRSLLNESGESYPKLSFSTESYDHSKELLISFFSGLIKFLSSQDDGELLELLVKNKAFRQHLVENPEIRDELVSLVKSLQEDLYLNKRQFQLLDIVVGILDNERSFLFRKMRKGT